MRFLPVIITLFLFSVACGSSKKKESPAEEDGATIGNRDQGGNGGNKTNGDADESKEIAETDGFLSDALGEGDEEESEEGDQTANEEEEEDDSVGTASDEDQKEIDEYVERVSKNKPMELMVAWVLQLADVDQSGKLSRDEFVNFRIRKKTYKKDREEKLSAMRVSLFNQFAGDDDQLDEGEIKKLLVLAKINVRKLLRKRGKVKKFLADYRKELLASYDLNNDGKIDRSEKRARKDSLKLNLVKLIKKCDGSADEPSYCEFTSEIKDYCDANSDVRICSKLVD